MTRVYECTSLVSSQVKVCVKSEQIKGRRVKKEARAETGC